MRRECLDHLLITGPATSPQCCARLVEHTTVTARSGHSGYTAAHRPRSLALRQTGLVAGDPDGEVTIAWSIAHQVMALYQQRHPARPAPGSPS
jgi:hypothetical protein